MAIKIDYYGQIIFLVSIVLMALAFPIFPVGIFYALFCIAPLGIWQLISAATRWIKYKHDKVKIKSLNLYWMFAIICISACIISITAVTSGNPLHYGVYKYLFVASLCGSVVVSVYYIIIYKKYYFGEEAKENPGIGRIA